MSPSMLNTPSVTMIFDVAVDRPHRLVQLVVDHAEEALLLGVGGTGAAELVAIACGIAGDLLAQLHQHQASDPGWASQPLWTNAQAVQQSGFPFAYAKWEAQAAHMVRHITTQLR